MKTCKVLAVSLVAGALSVGGVMAQELDPNRVQWSKITMSAKKMGFSTSSDIFFEKIPVAQGQKEFLKPDKEGAYLEPGGQELAFMRVVSSLLGRDSITKFWLDPQDATVFQRILVETGKRPRYKAYRFSETGAWEYRKNPVKGEEKKPHESWTNIRSEVDSYTGWPDGKPVTESAGLFYIVAAAPLDKAGDARQALVVSKEQVYSIDIRVKKLEQLKVNFSRVENGKATAVKGAITALHLTMEPIPPEGVDPKDFKLIGLEGAIDLWIDKDGRYPLQVEGKVPYAGKVKIRLRKVEIGS